MTVRKFLSLNRVLAVLSKGQLLSQGELPVVVVFTNPDGTKSEVNVRSASFNTNSGNVVLVC